MRGVVFLKNGHAEVFLIMFSHVVQHLLFQCLMFKSDLYLNSEKICRLGGREEMREVELEICDDDCILWLNLRCHAYAIMKV